MASENFIPSVTATLKWEGGYSDHPRDPGAQTNLGITIGVLSDDLGRKATVAEVKALTVKDAERIYRAKYWLKVRGDDLPIGLDYVTFDGAVNSGVGQSAKWTQRALGVKDDGKVGSATIAAALAVKNQVPVIQNACARRMSMLQGLKDKQGRSQWAVFGKGWGARVAGVEALAVKMALVAAGKHPKTVQRDLQDQGATAHVAADNAKVQGAGAAVGGTGSVGVFDMPLAAQIAIGAAVLVVLIFAVLKARRNKARADAYAAVAKDMA